MQQKFHVREIENSEPFLVGQSLSWIGQNSCSTKEMLLENKAMLCHHDIEKIHCTKVTVFTGV